MQVSLARDAFALGFDVFERFSVFERIFERLVLLSKNPLPALPDAVLCGIKALSGEKIFLWLGQI